mmetsp:Transcript_7815/g.22189  ORF Transcript_7815/g.22189 Transcript_7815/m.22189 type:complete len:304 (-) Transcript_7815:744-1655(-)
MDVFQRHRCDQCCNPTRWPLGGGSRCGGGGGGGGDARHGGLVPARLLVIVIGWGRRPVAPPLLCSFVGVVRGRARKMRFGRVPVVPVHEGPEFSLSAAGPPPLRVHDLRRLRLLLAKEGEEHSAPRVGSHGHPLGQVQRERICNLTLQVVGSAESYQPVPADVLRDNRHCIDKPLLPVHCIGVSLLLLELLPPDLLDDFLEGLGLGFADPPALSWDLVNAVAGNAAGAMRLAFRPAGRAGPGLLLGLEAGPGGGWGPQRRRGTRDTLGRLAHLRDSSGRPLGGEDTNGFRRNPPHPRRGRKSG